MQKISREKMSRQIFHALRDIFFALLFFVFIFEQLLMCVTFFRIFYFCFFFSLRHSKLYIYILYIYIYIYCLTWPYQNILISNHYTINPLQPGVAFLYPLKAPVLLFYAPFREYREATLGCNGLITMQKSPFRKLRLLCQRYTKRIELVK